MKNKEKKKDKEKVVYYDDGSTIANMDGVKQKSIIPKTDNNRPKSTGREKLKTFFEAFKMMLIPTGVALLVLLILYLIFMLIGSYAN